MNSPEFHTTRNQIQPRNKNLNTLIEINKTNANWTNRRICNSTKNSVNQGVPTLSSTLTWTQHPPLKIIPSSLINNEEPKSRNCKHAAGKQILKQRRKIESEEEQRGVSSLAKNNPCAIFIQVPAYNHRNQSQAKWIENTRQEEEEHPRKENIELNPNLQISKPKYEILTTTTDQKPITRNAKTKNVKDIKSQWYYILCICLGESFCI